MISIDAHMDTPWLQTKFAAANPTSEVFSLKYGHESSMFTTPKAKIGGLDSVIMALYLSDAWQDTYGAEAAHKEILNQRSRLVNGAGNYFVTKMSEAKLVKDNSSFVSTFIALEGGRLIDDSLDRLREYAELGIKYLTLTHNRNTSWADSSTDVSNHCGLTTFGRKVIKECNLLNVAIDISHASDHTAHHALDLSAKPVIATHSGAKALVNQPRNLNDSLIERIGESCGIICVPYAKRFIGHYKVADHIQHIADIIGTHRVGIGSDMDGAVMIPGVTSVNQWRDVVANDLINKGWSTSEIEGVFGDNLAKILGA